MLDEKEEPIQAVMLRLRKDYWNKAVHNTRGKGKGWRWAKEEVEMTHNENEEADNNNYN